MKSLKCAVLGQPIAHSLSPEIHNYWFEQHQIDGHYEAIECPGTTHDLGKTLAQLRSDGYRGCNLTLPLKELVLQIDDVIVGPDAELAGAANTVDFHKQSMELFNTDIFGVRSSLDRMGFDQGNVLVLGAGGAARATVLALKQLEGVSLFVANRTAHKARQMCQHIGTPFQLVAWEANAIAEAMQSCDAIINTTSIELNQPDQMDMISPAIALGDKKCLDLVYSKHGSAAKSTQWCQWAESRGGETMDGLWMLVSQAAKSFEIWTSTKPDIEGAFRHIVTKIYA